MDNTGWAFRKQHAKRPIFATKIQNKRLPSPVCLFCFFFFLVSLPSCFFPFPSPSLFFSLNCKKRKMRDVGVASAFTPAPFFESDHKIEIRKEEEVCGWGVLRVEAECCENKGDENGGKRNNFVLKEVLKSFFIFQHTQGNNLGFGEEKGNFNA